MFFYILIAVLCAASSDGFSPTVNIPLGPIEGYTTQSANGRTIYAFDGIPYARPPVGKHRFKEPIPPKPWTGVWHAKTVFKCMQYDHFTPPGQDMVAGDEDCLYVNVYSPDLNPLKKLDVLVFIHGGAFMFNYGALYGPQMLLDRDIIYVTFNYRLGPLGFLSTEDNVVPGNNGLKDQVLALKWIKANIEYFGGNPDSITIMGMSAGGASVHFHYLLAESRGLFHKGISQSGVVFNPWVLAEHPLRTAKKLSSSIGCPTANSKSMVECLRKKPARQITQTVKQFQPWLYNPFSPFGAVVDTWATSPLLPEHPYQLIKSKKVQDLPWIASHVSGEGLYPASDFHHNHRLEYINEHWNDIMPYILHYNDAVDASSLDSVSEKIRTQFFQGKAVNKETFPALVKLISERLFTYDIDKGARLQSAAMTSPVYGYYFNYRGAHSKSEFRADTIGNIGISHGDDTSYVLKTSMDTLSTEDDKLMSKIMLDMVVSFMRTGKPNTTTSWEPLSKNPDDPWTQLHIESPYDMFVETKDDVGNNKFWQSLPFKENERLFPAREEL